MKQVAQTIMTEEELHRLVEQVVQRTLGSPEPTPQPSAGRQNVVAVGSDHRGLELKELVKKTVAELGYQVHDCGAYSPESVDYPDIAEAVGSMVASGQAIMGIVIDGAGIGSAVAANKIPGVRAALCYNQATAANAREHNDTNVLALGSGMLGSALALQITRTWLETPFAGGRHAKRVDKIRQIEQRYSHR